MLEKDGKTKPEDILTPEQEIKDPTVLEFLDLKDEYSESDLEDALIDNSTFAPRVITAFADSKREMQPYYFEG